MSKQTNEDEMRHILMDDKVTLTAMAKRYAVLSSVTTNNQLKNVFAEISKRLTDTGNLIMKDRP